MEDDEQDSNEASRTISLDELERIEENSIASYLAQDNTFTPQEPNTTYTPLPRQSLTSQYVSLLAMCPQHNVLYPNNAQPGNGQQELGIVWNNTIKCYTNLKSSFEVGCWFVVS